MHSLSSVWKVAYSLLLISFMGCAEKATENKVVEKSPAASIEADTFNIWSANRTLLTDLYAMQNYGDSTHTITPQMIVVHYTAIPTLEKTHQYFKPDSLESSRKNIIKQSALNVSAHYTIDYDGTITNLMADTLMARHLIGFNHVAIGIENIAGDEHDLTDEQLASNVALIKHLTDTYPTIRYLIGHSEYSDSKRPHYELLKVMDPNYQPYPKPDPGREFMKALRDKLKEQHDIALLD